MPDTQFSKKPAKNYPQPKVGRIYFSQNTERKIFFFLTLAVLLMGILIKTGIW